MYIKDLFSTTAYTKKDATAAQLTLDQVVPVRILLRQLRNRKKDSLSGLEFLGV